MWDLIVLGEIPGTQIQVSFQAWLVIVIVLSIILGLLLTVHYVRSSRLLAAWHIGHILQTTAYSQMLLSRRHMQA